MNTMSSFARLSDTDLLVQAKTLAAHERRATAQLIAALAELDARRLYLPQGCRSMFTYCTEILHLSESAAYARIEAARAARRFPGILRLLDEGAITLTTVGLLAAHLTEDNHARLLTSATHQSKRQVEALVAALTPHAPVPAVVRKLPARAVVDPQASLIADGDRSPAPSAGVDATHAGHPAVTAAVPPVKPQNRAKPAVVAPLSPDCYKLQLTMSKETHDKLRRVQDLMRHTNPTGDPAVIFDRAITMLLNSLEKAKLGATDRPRPSAPAPSGSSRQSRHIPTRSSVQCGRAMPGDARTSEMPAVAPRRGVSNITTSCRSPRVAPPWCRTSSYAVVPTTRTRRSAGSDRSSRAKNSRYTRDSLGRGSLGPDPVNQIREPGRSIPDYTRSIRRRRDSWTRN